MSLDKRYNRAENTAQSGFNRNDFEAVDGQTVFNLGFLLTVDSLVFVNHSLADKASYSGFGTKVLTFNNGRALYDKVTVIG